MDAEQQAEKQHLMEPNNNADVENGNVNRVQETGSTEQSKSHMAFNNASIRAGFVRKVFAIVTVMLLINIAMAASVLAVKDLRVFIHEQHWLYIVALVVFFATYLTLICCSSVARNFPCNVILLAVFTFAAGFMLMVTVARVPPYTVFLALVTTALTCFAIILFASQTTYDITSKMFVIFAATMAVFIFGIALAIWLHVAFSAIVCVLFMVHLALDIQMILGGRKYEISPEDYVFAALMLFIDIYEIFINLLNLFNAAN